MTLLRRLSLLVVLTAALLVGTSAVAPTVAVAEETRTRSSLLQYNSTTDLRPGETLWVSGSLTADGVALAGATVYLQFRTSGASYRTVATTTVSTGGSYSFAVRPMVLGAYRTVYLGSSTVQPSVRGGVGFTWGAGGRSLEARTQQIGAERLGTAVTDVVPVTLGGVPSRYQRFANGTLVEYGNTSKRRTWWVTGEADRQYWVYGGPTGRFGAPIFDVDCGLQQGGCLHRFVGGSVYWGPQALQTGVAFWPGEVSELMATAYSQVNYKAPTSNISKYNTWIGTNYAWCSIFLSWVSSASGNGSRLPIASRFVDFHNAVLRWGRTGTTPRMGALVFFDTHTSDGVRAATHAGLVVGYNSSYIWTIEGNTTPNDGSGGRGTYLKKRARTHSMLLYYAYPAYGS